jgi:hypothetical protein
MSNYRVINRKREVPVAAIQLGEDIRTLERIVKDLETIEPWNIGQIQTQDQRDFCFSMIRSTIGLVRTWERNARRKLQTEYLAP